MQSPNAGRGAVDDAREFGAKSRRAVFEQALLRFFSGKPGGVSVRFLRQFEPRHFAKVSSDRQLWLGRSGDRPRVFSSFATRFAAKVTGKGNLFHPAMNTSLFKSLQGSGLGVREAGFDAAFGEDPASAPGLNQQEFDAAPADAVTNGGDLLASFPKP